MRASHTKLLWKLVKNEFLMAERVIWPLVSKHGATDSHERVSSDGHR